jgi:ATP-dependent Clp protease adaptor protein ClpS
VSVCAATQTAEPASVTQSELARLWKVLIHDDPLTTFEFVHEILARRFGCKPGEARRIAQEAHDTGVALVVVLPLETAEFKVEQAHLAARAAGYPLSFTLEPAE